MPIKPLPNKAICERYMAREETPDSLDYKMQK